MSFDHPRWRCPWPAPWTFLRVYVRIASTQMRKPHAWYNKGNNTRKNVLWKLEMAFGSCRVLWEPQYVGNPPLSSHAIRGTSRQTRFIYIQGWPDSSIRWPLLFVRQTICPYTASLRLQDLSFFVGSNLALSRLYIPPLIQVYSPPSRTKCGVVGQDPQEDFVPGGHWQSFTTEERIEAKSGCTFIP